MKKIKVLHIIKSLGRGGAEMLLPETLKLHDTAKFEFHYIYFLPWKNQMVSDIETAGGKVTCFRATNNIQLLIQYKKVIKYCEENRIDLIHCHLPWAGFLGRIVYLKTKIPTIYTEHNMQSRYHFVTKFLNKWTYNYQSLAIAVSNDVSNSIMSQINPKIPIKTVLNGVNTIKFVRQEDAGIKTKTKLGIPKEALVIGTVAVFRFQKRLIEWLQVFQELSKNNKNVYGIIVGAGPLENEIKEELHNLKLENKVRFPGLQTDVKPYYAAMDIFMMSSSFEGLPIALLEAMSMECAIVTTNAGGIKETIRDNKDGLLCDVDEWKKLSKLCQIIIDDSNRLELHKKNARARAITSFSLEKMVGSLENIYIEILSKR